MSSSPRQIQVGFTENHTCSYLPDEQERIAISVDQELQNDMGYELLLANGFRRSGETLYMPHCDSCKACQAIRLPVTEFSPSRSQKRLLNKSAHLTCVAKQQLDEEWFDIYACYIEAKHKDGSMYPANRENFLKFVESEAISTRYLHIYDENQLVAVAVTDVLATSASAFYTFYQPDYPVSLGTLAVLLQIKYCKVNNLQWLYLGYQIDQCPAMNYKVKFNPHQRLVNRLWQG